MAEEEVRSVFQGCIAELTAEFEIAARARTLTIRGVLAFAFPAS